MGSFNPYAPSKASLGGASTPASGDGQVWRDGKTVVMLHDVSLPARCVKCNEPADQPTKVRTMYWVNPFIYLLLFAGVLILLIVYMIVRKKADVDPGLCLRHKKRRLFAMVYGTCASIGGLIVTIAGGMNDVPALVLLGVLLMVSSIVVAMAMGRMIYAKKIDKDEVRLRGFCTAYLDDLPDYPR